jgi:uncharacterized membrane protein YhhN
MMRKAVLRPYGKHIGNLRLGVFTYIAVFSATACRAGPNCRLRQPLCMSRNRRQHFAAPATKPALNFRIRLPI